MFYLLEPISDLIPKREFVYILLTIIIYIEYWYVFLNRIYLSEDVSVGVWLSPLNITRLHDVRFNTEYLSRGCSNSFIVTHKQSPENMRTLYSTLINKGVLCKSENITRKTYDYNWQVLPSKCCVPKL